MAASRKPGVDSRLPPDVRGRPGGCNTTTGPSDYGHRFHAGNVGDVWKHCVLGEVLRCVAGAARVAYLDTHAGEGSYALGPTGEWTEGVGRLMRSAPDQGPAARYREIARRLTAGDDRCYPGSPAQAAALLSTSARLNLWERDPTACTKLATTMGGDPRVQIVCGDGMVGLVEAVRRAEAEADEVVVLVDPPYTAKAEWLAVPDAVADAVGATTRARFLLWYPVKSLTRPNAMLARFEAAGVRGTTAELVTTALDLQRNRLNGSGVILFRPPTGVLATVAAAAPAIGECCATQPGTWSFRMRTWVGSGPGRS